MSDIDETTRLPDDFDGRVRLFPLPELVVFPHVMQALHIFEPRYCELLDEALQSDRLIAMATLTSGMADLLSPQPIIAPIVCIGKIISHVETADATHNILLVGVKRATIIRELSPGRPFRMAEVEVAYDIHPTIDPQERKLLRAALLETFASVLPQATHVQKNLHELLTGNTGLGPLTDLIAYSMALDTAEKLQLLSEVDVDQRARQLIRALKKFEAKSNRGNEPKFPPRFSVN